MPPRPSRLGVESALVALALIGLTSALISWPASTQAYETQARAAIVVDHTTQTVLLEKNADTPLPPASMSKIMTLYMAFEAVRDGRLSLQERLPVSKKAMSLGGSTMFLDTSDRVTVEDLLRGIIVLSGNDASVVIAETLSPDGTEAGFARQMTQRAQQLGMTNSTFVNATGWPEAGHAMSMRDLALLATRLIEDFPEFYPLFAQTEFLFDGRAPQNVRNRNPLLALDIGADGLKTGHTSEAGFGLVGSAVQGDRRVIFVIGGLDSAEQRAREAEGLVNWAFRQFSEQKLVSAGDRFARAQVWMGEEPSVNLVAAQDVTALLPVLSAQNVPGEVVYDGPLRAPIAQGDKLGELVITPEGMPEIRVPLVADYDVAKGGFVATIGTVANLLLTRLQNGPPNGAEDPS